MSDVRSKGSEIDVLDSVRVIWRYRWLIVGICSVVTIATYVVNARRPKVYESTTTILAPKAQGSGELLSTIAASGLLHQMPGISLPSLTPDLDAMVEILKSRRLAGAVVERFNLQERYGARSIQQAISALQRSTLVSLTTEGQLAIRVEHTDPVLAADIANFYAEELERLVGESASGEASRQRAFIVEQLTLAKGNLEKVEDALRRFQERNRAIALQDQARGAIEAAARLKGEILGAEVQLRAMRSFATDSNSEVISLRRGIDEMRRQLAQMQYGHEPKADIRPGVRGNLRRDIYVPVARVPAVGVALARYTRDLKVQETLVTLLAQQYEQAKITEAKDTPLVQVLDRAFPAGHPSGPATRLSLMISGIASLVAALFLAFFIDYVRGLVPGVRQG